MKNLFTIALLLGLSYGLFSQTSTPPASGNGTEGDPYQIATLENLYWLSQTDTVWHKFFNQTADINASTTESWDGGNGFSPIGNTSIKFTGSYNGKGHVVDSLYISRDSDHVGLFGCTYEAEIDSLGLTNVDVSGTYRVAGLIGWASNSNISNCFSKGDVTSGGTDWSFHVAGLVGFSSGSTVSNCYTDGSVTGYQLVGGLIGNNSGSVVSNCYSFATVNGNLSTGGLVGYFENNSTMINCYSTGLIVFGGGGLIGEVYALTPGTITNSFWDTQTSGETFSAGGVGKTTAQMKNYDTFFNAGWDFMDESINGTDDSWGIDETGVDYQGYPFLHYQGFTNRIFPTVSTESPGDITETSATLNGTIVSLGVPNPYSYGFCINTTGGPTVTDDFIDLGGTSSTGTYSSSIDTFSTSFTYYVRACAINSTGISYGEEISFETALGEFSASPTSLDFGELGIGETKNDTVTVSNTGIGTLFITGVSNSLDDFAVTPLTADIPVGESQDFVVSYACSSIGSVADSIIFTHNVGSDTIPVTANGACQAAADAGNCISFDGTDDFIYVSNPVDLPSNYTVEFWVKTSATDHAMALTGFYQTSTNSSPGIFVEISNAGIIRYVHRMPMGSGGGQEIYSTNAYNDGKWHHIAATKSGSSMYLYVDGQQVGSNSGLLNFTSVMYPVFGKNGYNDTERVFDGMMDELRVWNISLTQEEIRTQYGSLVGDESGLLAYWRFDEESGTTAVDGTGNGNAGTLVNSPTRIASSAPVGDPEISVDPVSLDFGRIGLESDSTRSITVGNIGGGILHIGDIFADDADFTAGSTSANIMAGADTTVDVTFAPTSLGAKSAELIFESNIDNNTIQMQGTGSSGIAADAGNCIWLDGIDDYIKVVSPVTLANDYTLDFWLNTSTTGKSMGVMGLYSSLFASAPGVYCQIEPDGRMRYLHRSPTGLGGGVNAYSSASVNDGQWHHVACVKENTSISLYIDGELIGSYTGASNFTVDLFPVFGKNGVPDTEREFEGSIDEVRLWNTALSTDDIRSRYGSQSGNNMELVAYWRFDEESGAATIDHTGNGHDGALLNTPWFVSSTAPIGDPVISFDPESLDFGGVVVADDSVETITIANTGGGILHIDNISTEETEFTINPTSTNIMAGNDAEIEVTFEPSSTGEKSSDLIFESNIDNDTMQLTGTGCLLPTVTTQAVTDIYAGSATGNGTISNLGNPNPVSYGFCWGTVSDPIVTDNNVDLGTASATGSYTETITGLLPNTTYYVRAYAINLADTVYGNEVSFTTIDGVADVDGNAYNLVTIGSQTWMKENLNTSKYKDGTSIDNLTSNTNWINATSGAWSYINNDEGYADRGKLYNWFAVENAKGVCPDGWHIPAASEWDELITYLGGSSVAGSKLKQTGTETWQSPNSFATNESGFTALACGFRSRDNGQFLNISTNEYWWTGDEYDGNDANVRYVVENNANVSSNHYDKNSGFSIRCLKNTELVLSTQDADSITYISAQFNGSVDRIIDDFPTAHGFCWSETSNPTVDDDIVDLGVKNTSGSFSALVTGLSPTTIYYCRSFAINSSDTVYGNEVTFETNNILISGVSGEWGNPAVWGGTVPAMGDKVVIAGGVTITVPAAKETAECTDLTIDPLGSFTVEGTLNIGNNILIRSDATGTGSFVDNGTVNVAGISKVQQYVAQDRWWYLTQPVDLTSSSVFDANTTSHYLYYWNEGSTNHGWNQINDGTEVLNQPMKGYASYYNDGDKTIEFTGDLNNGDLNITLSRTFGVEKEGYNLIGNPYPSSYDLYQFSVGYFVYSSVWYRTYYGGSMNFAHYNSELDEGTNGAQRYAPPMQAFWVKVSDEHTTENVSFANANRVHSTQGVYKNVESSIVRLAIEKDGQNDEALVAFHMFAEEGTDKFDTEKMHPNTNELCELYTLNNYGEMAINTLPVLADANCVDMGYSAPVEGEYTISLSELQNLDATIYLEDKFSGSKVNLNEQDYKFCSQPVVQDTRFVLHILKNTLGTVDDIENAINVYAANNSIYVNAAGAELISLFDMNGRKCAEIKSDGTVLQKIDVDNQAKGVYIVRIMFDDKVISQKVVVK